MTRTPLNQLRDEMLAVARGKRDAAPLPVRALLGTLSSQGNFELLRVIVHDRPESVSRLAALTGRAQSNVSRALRDLARHGLVRLERHKLSVRPVATTARIDIDLALGTYRAVPIGKVTGTSARRRRLAEGRTAHDRQM